jgi:DNA repair protein RadC
MINPLSAADADAVPDRPRERLWSHGSDHVSDTELLGLVLGTGRRGKSAGAVAAEVLHATGGVAGLARAWPHDLADVDGIGPGQAARVIAAVTLGLRVLESTVRRLGPLHCGADVYRRLWPRTVGRMQEVFYVIGIDARNTVVTEVEIARGHLTSVDVHPREVFRPLIRAAAAAGVVVHNHPSGDPTPSPQDLDLTQRLKDAGALLGIPIIDHVVMADSGYVSIAEWVATRPATEPPQ